MIYDQRHSSSVLLILVLCLLYCTGDVKMAYPHLIYDQRHSSSLLLILVLHLLCCTGGKCVVVKTRVGDDAVLPCVVDPTQNPTIDLTEMAIEWTRLDLPPDQYVYFQRDGVAVIDDQIPIYTGRTSLFMDEVKKGNVSLKLSRVTTSDEANYICFLPEISAKFTVQLIVEVPTDGGFPVWVVGVIIALVVIIGVLFHYRKSIWDCVDQYRPAPTHDEGMNKGL